MSSGRSCSFTSRELRVAHCWLEGALTKGAALIVSRCVSSESAPTRSRSSPSSVTSAGLPPIRHLIAASFFTTFHPAPELIAGHADIFSVYSLLDIGAWTLLILGMPTLLMGYGFANLMREGLSV